MKSFALGVLLVVAGSAGAQGIAWMPASYQSLIADSDLIVVGKVGTPSDSAHDEGWTACGQITVSQTLKGVVPHQGVKVDYPSRRPAAYGGSEIEALPGEVIFEQGQEGIWFLKKNTATNHYVASHPGRFKPLPFLNRVKAEIAKAP
jgi:hypothetical protein